MHGVKVYLKSGRDRLYRGMVTLSGLGLLIVSIYYLELNGNLWKEAALYGMFGLVLVIHSLLNPKVRKRTRYLPTFLLLLASVFLFWTCLAASSSVNVLPPAICLSVGTLSGILALAGPMTVGTRFAYFSPRRIYLRYSIFKSIQFSWEEVENVQLEDDFLEIGLLKGKDIRLVPSYTHTQHLRSYLDEIWTKARQSKQD